MEKAIVIFCIAVVMTGCSKSPQTLEYYKSHITEAQQVSKDCKNANLKDTDILQNCDNAGRAISWFMFKNGNTKLVPYGSNKINTNY